MKQWRWNMTPLNTKSIPKLRKAPQPPLSYPGAPPDSDRAKKPPLGERRVTEEQKRVPVRRGALPRKAASRIKIALILILVLGSIALIWITLHEYAARS